MSGRAVTAPRLLRLLAAVAVLAAVALPAGLAAERASVAAADCTVSRTLVNSCRAWLGVTAGGYPQVGSDRASQFAYAEQRLSDPAALEDPAVEPTRTARFDLLHTYHGPTATTFSTFEQEHAARPGSYLYVNWRPDPVWAQAAGSDPLVTARIDEFARSVKGLGARLFLAVHHEPEDEVSVDHCTTPVAGASAGSPADYRAMWEHVRDRFDAAGVDNVVWTMNYMGATKWDCLVPQLWPGDALVDWVTWDPYAPQGGFVTSVGRFYDRLTALTDATHDFTGKPWGLAEMGSNTSAEVAAGYWDEGRQAVLDGRFPRIRMWMPFDTANNGGLNGGLRVGYDDQGALAPVEQAAFSAFGASVLGLAAPAPPAEEPLPAVTGLKATATSSTAVDLTWSALSGATGYQVHRDGLPVATVGAVARWSDTGLTAGTQYTYRVAGISASGLVGALSEPAKVRTPSGKGKPGGGG